MNTIYYNGSVSEYSNIKIGNNNDEFAKKLYYYSETNPNDTTYKYWHYVDETPTIWS